jgi:hypothetical protein
VLVRAPHAMYASVAERGREGGGYLVPCGILLDLSLEKGGRVHVTSHENVTCCYSGTAPLPGSKRGCVDIMALPVAPSVLVTPPASMHLLTYLYKTSACVIQICMSFLQISARKPFPNHETYLFSAR